MNTGMDQEPSIYLPIYINYGKDLLTIITFKKIRFFRYQDTFFRSTPIWHRDMTQVWKPACFTFTQTHTHTHTHSLSLSLALSSPTCFLSLTVHTSSVCFCLYFFLSDPLSPSLFPSLFVILCLLCMFHNYLLEDQYMFEFISHPLDRVLETCFHNIVQTISFGHRPNH